MPPLRAQGDPVDDTLMWEAAAAPGRLAELLVWVDDVAAPAVLALPGCLDVSSYHAGDDRAVIIAVFRDGAPRIDDPPQDLLRRPVHQWRFQRRWTHRPAGS